MWLFPDKLNKRFSVMKRGKNIGLSLAGGLHSYNGTCAVPLFTDICFVVAVHFPQRDYVGIYVGISPHFMFMLPCFLFCICSKI